MKPKATGPPVLAALEAPILRPHLGILDALRGFAALAVVLYHFTGEGLVKFHNPGLGHLFAWGYLGVDVFFVISGFVIPYSLWDTGYTARAIGPYFLRRALRICPPAWAALALLLVQWAALDHFLPHAVARTAGLTPASFAANVLFVAPFTGHAWLNAVFWTLALEFQFYLIIGLLFQPLFVRTSLVKFMALSLAMGALARFPVLPGENYFVYAPLFMLGGSTLLYRQGVFSRRDYAIAACGLLGTGALVLSPWVLAFGAATAACIAFVPARHPAFAFLGKVSYSLYLTHFLAGASAEFVLSRFFHPASAAGHVAGVGLCVAAAVVGATVFYYAIELPCTRWAKRIMIGNTARLAQR